MDLQITAGNEPEPPGGTGVPPVDLGVPPKSVERVTNRLGSASNLQLAKAHQPPRLASRLNRNHNFPPVFLAILLLASTQPFTPNTFATDTNSTPIIVPATNDALEKEYQTLLAEQNTAQTEVAGWMRANQAPGDKSNVPGSTLNDRIRARFALLSKAYENFLARHPDYAPAQFAYGNFLSDIHDENGAIAHWEKSRELDPNNPLPWTRLADFYSRHGQSRRALQYYEQAAKLKPAESAYSQNLARAIILLRRDAGELYHLDEQQVFTRVIELYHQALEHDPGNFALAAETARAYYSNTPFRTEPALAAWTNALHLARTELEDENVYLNVARINANAHRFGEAHKLLDLVTNDANEELKGRVLHRLKTLELEATNTPTAIPASHGL